MKTTFLIASLLISTLASSEDVASKPLKEQHQQLFEKRKGLEEQSHNERIRILQEADSCIKNAKTSQEYKACEQKEQQVRQTLKEQQKPQHEALKKEREALREKAIEKKEERLKLREERMKNKEYPKGKIETH